MAPEEFPRLPAERGDHGGHWPIARNREGLGGRGHAVWEAQYEVNGEQEPQVAGGRR
jgi:hypothetical protein